jgi:hypothetical protein
VSFLHDLPHFDLTLHKSDNRFDPKSWSYDQVPTLFVALRSSSSSPPFHFGPNQTPVRGWCRVPCVGQTMIWFVVPGAVVVALTLLLAILLAVRKCVRSCCASRRYLQLTTLA